MKYFALLTFFISATAGLAQTKITGRVLDKRTPIEFANVLVKDSYDGTSTDANGKFSFETEEEGKQILIIRMLGFIQSEIEIDCNGKDIDLGDIKLKEDPASLDPVVISAGAFEAGDEKKSVVLNSIDIVTTAGANGDIFQAIQTLPGSQQVGDQEGLFVRGGDASETKTIIDEMIVQNPFFSSVPDVPQRGRFSPFLFKGTVFSTGGYSAVYGQALSSALVLNTVDMFKQNNTGIGILPVGFSLSHTKSWDSTAVSVSAGYTNLKPYFSLVQQNRNWITPPSGLNGSATFRQQVGKTGIFKFYTTFSQNKLALNYENIDDSTSTDYFGLNNQNVYINTSYKQFLNDKWIFFIGTSFSHNEDDLDNSFFTLKSKDQLGQGKVIFTRSLMENSFLKFGHETHYQNIDANFNGFGGKLDAIYNATFAEADLYFTKKIAGRIGTRLEHSEHINKFNVAPRASLAIKTGKFSQASLAYGLFYQTPENQYLFALQNNLNFENAQHFIANWQIMKDERIFRIEAYNKEYGNLVTYDLDAFGGFSNIMNKGFGYAQGFDIFYRDKKTLKNTDFWISYSFLDTQRKYQNFPISAAPTFTSKHNLSLVYKHWFAKIKTSAGFTYSYNSGRPYYNPNLSNAQFHSETLPQYNMLNLNASYLTTIKGQFTVIFFSINNVLNLENSFSRRYSSDGTRFTDVGQTQGVGVFAGMFISINHDKSQKVKLTPDEADE